MTDAAVPEDLPAPKKSKLPMVLGLVLALLGGGGGFAAVHFGLLEGLLGPKTETADAPPPSERPFDNSVFVEIPPLTVTLANPVNLTHLRFRVSLEVPRQHEDEIRRLTPRMQDLMNNYLRALDGEDFEDPAVLFRVRSQLLRRLQFVGGADRVLDVLVVEFVLT